MYSDSVGLKVKDSFAPQVNSKQSVEATEAEFGHAQSDARLTLRVLSLNCPARAMKVCCSFGLWLSTQGTARERDTWR